MTDKKEKKRSTCAKLNRKAPIKAHLRRHAHSNTYMLAKKSMDNGEKGPIHCSDFVEYNKESKQLAG